jgi:multiple sugar transport system permease protein
MVCRVGPSASFTGGERLGAASASTSTMVRPRKRFQSERSLGTILLVPAISFIALLVGGPLVLAVWLSFSDATGGSLSGDFVGLTNFTRAFESAIFRRALLNTFIFTIASQVLVLVLGRILAAFLVKDFWGKWILRFFILLPWAAPIALGAIGWKWIFDSLYSVLNWTLEALHLIAPGDFPQWLGEPTLAMVSIIAVHAWRILPFATVIMLAGQASIPQEVEEAALVDGAVGWRKQVYVTLPMLLPVMTIALLFGIVFTATDMAVVYILTRGGPFNSTHMVSTWAFQTGVLSGSTGAGAAMSLSLFPILVVAAILMLRFARRVDVGL